MSSCTTSSSPTTASAFTSAADCVVLPYKSATQSGVTQIAYNFCTPMIVTDVGGLSEIVPDAEVGIRLPADRGRRHTILCRIYEGDTLDRFARRIETERRRFVGGDVRPYRGAVRHRAEEIGVAGAAASRRHNNPAL